MARHELLSEAEREQLLGIPRDRDKLARLYTLERSDFEIIQRRRGKRNRLGIALQLAMLRHPGTPARRWRSSWTASQTRPKS